MEPKEPMKCPACGVELTEEMVKTLVEASTASQPAAPAAPAELPPADPAAAQ